MSHFVPPVVDQTSLGLVSLAGVVVLSYNWSNITTGDATWICGETGGMKWRLS